MKNGIILFLLVAINLSIMLYFYVTTWKILILKSDCSIFKIAYSQNNHAKTSWDLGKNKFVTLALVIAPCWQVAVTD